MKQLCVHVRFGLFWCLLGVLLSACATSYHPPESTQALYEKLAQQEKGGPRAVTGAGEDLRIEVYPMLDPKISRPTLGIDPTQYNLLPVFLKGGYSGQDPIKVDLVHSFVSVKENPHWFIPVEVALERIGKDDSAATVGLGLMIGFFAGPVGVVVGMAAGSAADSTSTSSTTIEEHYYRQRYGPTILPSGSEGAGVVFFDVPWEEVDPDEFVLTLPVINLNTNETRSTNLSFRAKDKTR